MEVAAFIDRLCHERFYQGQVVHVRRMPARPSRYDATSCPLNPVLHRLLARSGIDQLYAHQARAIGEALEGRSVVVVTGTASGKTLCYMVPVLESVLSDSSSTSLFVYPTKALAQDQLRALTRFQAPDEGLGFLAGTYDGDTPQGLRRKLRDHAHVILSNPDMLSQGIMPQHPRWSRFFAHLKYVVIDEVHSYRGVFGSHVANVLKRLRRICAHYGATPQFVCCSATIANPLDHAQRICGVPMELVDNDGSPRGPRQFVMWNPPPVDTSATGDPAHWRTGGDRRSPVGEASKLMAALVREDIQTIAFTRTRLSAELVLRGTREILEQHDPRLARTVEAYRGGYLPEERREIERKLSAREVLGVASTNALELGIDIGSLDACIMVGYPGSVASMWQQAGRAGRGTSESAVFLVGQNAPLDQYLMAHHDYLFGRSPEQAIVDPENPHIVIGHLKCAAAELPLRAQDLALFGACAEPILGLLQEDSQVRKIDGAWYWASSAYAAEGLNLRAIAGPVYTIEDVTRGNEVIGTLDETGALEQLYTHAVYLHGGETYFVEQLDTARKIVTTRRQDLEYYTQSVQSSQIRLDREDSRAPWHEGELGFGDVTVTTWIPMFKKIRFHSRESLGFEHLELPPIVLETVSLWLAPPLALDGVLREKGLEMGRALVGIANVLLEVAPMFVLCDTKDVGVTVDSASVGREAIFLYDKYPGGMGFARRCREQFDDIMRTVDRVVRECGCEDGCPSCVGSSVPAGAMGDMDQTVRGRIPHKLAARMVLEAMVR